MGLGPETQTGQEGTGFASVSGFAPQKPSPQRQICLHLTPKTSLPGVPGSTPAQHGTLRAGGQINDPAGKKEEGGREGNEWREERGRQEGGQ